MVYRKKLEDDVNNNGGEYRGNLTKDVTHLIAKEPSGAKHKYAIDWKIKIVGVEWLEQSLERGLILDEQLYSLALPPADRGRNAWIRRVVSSSSLGKRSFDGDLAPNGPRKLRRTASAKLNSQNVGFWTDIVNGDVKKEEQKHNQWSEEALKDESSRATKAAGTLTERFDSHANSSTPIVTPAAPPFGAPHARLLDKTGIFAGRRICLHGFNEKKVRIPQQCTRSGLLNRTRHLSCTSIYCPITPKSYPTIHPLPQLQRPLQKTSIFLYLTTFLPIQYPRYRQTDIVRLL